jgi:hypothetical protein
MTYRPYPNPDRARHQLDRHHAPEPVIVLPNCLRPMTESLAKLRAGAPPLVRYVIGLSRDVGDVRAMTLDEVATLRQKYERPVGGEENTP